MKSKQALKNIFSVILMQLAMAVSGFILPHFFITVYGSVINGMISSVTQFLSYLSLVEAGISAASVLGLYVPLANGDIDERNRMLSYTKKFYFHSGILYTLLLVILMIVYPIIVKGQADSITTRLMILVLAGSNLVDYYVLGKYRVLLTADQRLYVINNVQTLGTFLNVAVSLLLIYFRENVVIVKGAATLIYVLRSVIVIVYVRRKYERISFDYPCEKGSANNVIPQRWNALFHQVVGVICNNTDIVLITICLGARSLIEASVYYVYNLVNTTFSSLFNSLSNALVPTFGELFALKKDEELKRAYSTFEYIFLMCIAVLFSCMYMLFLPFVEIYTKGATDADYSRPLIAVLFVVMGVMQSIRIPSLTMICAAGHYKQTQYRALAEAIINFTVSIVLIFKLGIAGAVIGTICSYAYRTTDCIVYTSRHLVNGTLKKSLLRVLRNVLVSVVMCFVFSRFINGNVAGWGSFVLYGIVYAALTFVAVFAVNFLWEINEMKLLLNKVKGIVRK